MMDEKEKAELQSLLSRLKSPVRLLFFTQKNACPACVQQLELLEALASLSDKLKLQVYDFVLNGDEVRNYGIDKIPATAVAGKKDYGIWFYGLTLGYEFASLINAILMASTEQSGLDPQLEMLVKGIEEPIHMQVMVTLTCPYCPNMVHVADQFALVNDKIRADLVDIAEFPQLAQKYDVSGVPKTIINETYSFEGALPASAVYLEVLKALSPEEYTRVEESIREFQGVRRAKKAEENHEYEVAVAGGGPAAMSAAIYAVRKGLDTALIAPKFGGQLNYTAHIENYLGLPDVSGTDMVETFRNHFEKYPVAEAVGMRVTRISRGEGGFLVETADGRRFKALSVVYCAGMEYRRLGVPGEDRFIGRGVGFCATCDAPLYRGKRVAVVGGGNSAFTAVRDLSGFASEVHLVHRREEFRADAELVKEVSGLGNVVFHRSMVVSSFLGKDRLAGVRLEAVDGSERFDLAVEGVFLEVGLAPNSDALRGLVELNERGEVPVGRDGSTAVRGLFAAGDVTDVGEKQISVAVGNGALAALSAYRFLVENRLTGSRVSLREAWQ